jgi:hypothetical protein
LAALERLAPLQVAIKALLSGLLLSLGSALSAAPYLSLYLIRFEEDFLMEREILPLERV